MAGQDGCGAAAGVLRVVGTGTNTNEQDPVATVINYILPRNVCVYAAPHTPNTSRSKPRTCTVALSTQSKSETVRMSIYSAINCSVLTEQNILQQQRQMNSLLIT